MPHVVVEYTDNVPPSADIPGLLRLIGRRCAASDGVLPVAGIRVRAHRLSEYFVADGTPGYAFVNVTVKMGSGRSPEFKKMFFPKLFDAIREHLGEASRAAPLALSMYVEEIDEDGAFRDNGVRAAMGVPPK